MMGYSVVILDRYGYGCYICHGTVKNLQGEVTMWQSLFCCTALFWVNFSHSESDQRILAEIWALVPPLSLSLERTRMSTRFTERLGLIKGNQWLTSPDHTALFLGGGTLGGGTK